MRSSAHMATTTRKRKTADDHSITSKNKKRKTAQEEKEDEGKLKRFLSLVSNNDSLIAGQIK